MKKQDYSLYRFSRAEWLRYAAEGSFLSLAAGWLFYGRPAAALPLLALVPLWMRRMRQKRIRERKEALRDGLCPLLEALLFSYRAGRATESAFPEAGRSIRASLGPEHPLCAEWDGIAAGMRLGLPADRLLSDFARRSGVEEIEQFAAVFSVVTRTGGDLPKVIESAARQLTEAVDTQREIASATAAKAAEHRVMCAMPPGIILYMRLASPGYLDPLYTSLAGILTMTGCLIAYAGAVLLGGKITRITV